MKKAAFAILIAGLIGLLFYMLYTVRQGRNALLWAEEVMEAHPDSALVFLQSLPENERRMGENRAFHALLLTRALFKNYTPPESDSLIRIAFDYYSHSSDSLRKAWSCYYYGRICKNNGEDKRALAFYQQAASAAGQGTDYKLLKLIYNYWGLLLQYKKPYVDGINKLKKSLEYAELRNDTFGQITTLRDLGISYIWCEDYDLSLAYQTKGLKLAKLFNDTDILSNYYNSLGVLYYQQQNYKKALDFANHSLKFKEDSAHCFSSWSLKGDIFICIKQYDSARYYINKAGIGNSFYLKAGYFNQLSKLEEKLGNYKVALEYRNTYTEYMDSIKMANENMEVMALQKKYDYTLVENDRNRILLQKKRIQNILLITVLLAVLLLGVFLYFFYKKQQRAGRFLQMANETVKQMQARLLAKAAEAEQKEADLCSARRQLEKTEVLKIPEVLALTYDIEKQEKQKEFVFRMNNIVAKIDSLNSFNDVQLSKQHDLVLSIQEREDLLQVVDWYYDGFVSRLQKEYPVLVSDELQLCALLRMSVPTRNIYVLLGLNSESLKKRKTRIKNERMKVSVSFKTLDQFLLQF